MNETTNDNDNLSSYANETLMHEMTVINDAVNLMIGSSHTTIVMSQLAEPLMRRYNLLRNELIARTCELN